MTSTPTTPVSVRRNNFSPHSSGSGDNDVTNISRIPLPSPGSFRRSISLRMRGSKSSLLSPTTMTTLGITKTAIPSIPPLSQFTLSSGGRTSSATIHKKIITSSVETLTPRSSSTLTLATNTTNTTNSNTTITSGNNAINKPPTTVTSRTSPSFSKLSSTSDVFRPATIPRKITTTTTTTTNTEEVKPMPIASDDDKITNGSVTNKSSFDTTISAKEQISGVELLNEHKDITALENSKQQCSNDKQQNFNNNEKNSINSINTVTDGKEIIQETNMDNIKNVTDSSSSSMSNCATTATVKTANSDLKKVSPCGNNKRDPNGMTLNLNGPTAVTPTSSGSITTAARTPKTPHTPRTPITGPLSRTTPKTPPVTPDSPHIYLDDDLDSLYSYSSATSGRSTMSCEHPYVARNGTTFSGRKMKYVVHCSSYAGQVGEDYLTPTQRAQKQLRRLKELLTQARQDLEQKDSEILRLTREVVELRLFKASLSSPEDRSNSSDAVTVREATTDLKTSQDVSPIVDMVDESNTKSSPRHILHSHHGINQVQFLEKMSSSEMQSSFADSGHFEDMTTSSVHSKDSYVVHTQDKASGSDSATIEDQREELIRMYEKKIEELIKNQETATTEIKRTHNDRVEALLQKLAECNSRYADLVPDYEAAKERIRELEKQLEDLQRKLQEQEEKQNKMYLHMYTKEQEAERMAQADKMLELAHRPSNRVSITELLKQLQSTQDELENIRAANCRSESGSSLLSAKEAISLWVLGARKTIYRRLLEAQENRTKVDPEITLQFLKSAIYYFLTDKDNSQGHLNAIESILEFSEQEKQNINRARSSK